LIDACNVLRRESHSTILSHELTSAIQSVTMLIYCHRSSNFEPTDFAGNGNHKFGTFRTIPAVKRRSAKRPLTVFRHQP
jgi:hypothetical protein